MRNTSTHGAEEARTLFRGRRATVRGRELTRKQACSCPPATCCYYSKAVKGLGANVGIEPTMEAVEITSEDPALARIRMPAVLDGAARPELLPPGAT